MSSLVRIKAAGFTVELDGGDLVVEPFSKLTPPQVLFLKSHKTEIIQELKREQAANDKTLIDYPDDRHHCRECQRLINGQCITQRFRPVDDIPRRCDDFVEGRCYEPHQ